MELFPVEIKRMIFEFDPTKREAFDKVVHQINFIHVLEDLRDKKKCFSTWHFNYPNTSWWYWHLRITRAHGQKKICDEEMRWLKNKEWRRYRSRTLRISPIS